MQERKNKKREEITVYRARTEMGKIWNETDG